MSVAHDSTVPPSEELLGEAARRVGEVYPGLYAHQRAGISFLLARRRAILADDMGLGKTRQAIIAAREAAPDGPFLVICPAGVKLNWRREIGLVDADPDVQVLHGKDAFDPNRRWTVVNYDILGRFDDRFARVEWGAVIVDEAHFIKNGSRRATQVLRLVGADGNADPQAVYLLTGTPMTNRPRDLFNLLRAVRHPLGKSFYSFAKRYCDAVDNGYGLDSRGASNVEELAKVVSGVMLRRAKSDALDLPPKTRTWQPVEVDGKRFRQQEARALAFYEAHPERSGPTWTQFLGLLTQARQGLAVAKVPHTLEAVRERLELGEKVVVFSSFTEPIEKLKSELGDAAVVITGSTTQKRRAAAEAAFQKDASVRVLLGNLHAAGIGINLTAGTHVVFNDLDWVPGNHWQAEDRIYRIGQLKPAFVTYLVAERTLDDFVAALLEQKARTIGVLEEEAADHATLLEQAIEAALHGHTPVRAPAPRREPGEASVGLLGDVLDLLARAGRGLGALEPEERVITVASNSDPSRTYEVRLSGGVATCTCPGFDYRGNCSHSRAVVAELSDAA
jgi:SWI/SNF-related matrix-associated actin-dependent regulator 1 of chromatin subfamily A